MLWAFVWKENFKEILVSAQLLVCSRQFHEPDTDGGDRTVRLETEIAELCRHPTENLYDIILVCLRRTETVKYIAVHIANAGVKQDFFTNGAEDVVYNVSAGIH